MQCRRKRSKATASDPLLIGGSASVKIEQRRQKSDQPHMRTPITAQRIFSLFDDSVFLVDTLSLLQISSCSACYSQASNAQRLSEKNAFNFIQFTRRNRWFVGRHAFSPMHTMVHCRVPHAWSKQHSTLVLVRFDEHYHRLMYSGVCLCFEECIMQNASLWCA